MKKLIAIIAIAFSLSSCGEKLPANIQSALSWYEIQVDNVNKSDSLILSLKPEDIDKMSSDSITILLGANEMQHNAVTKADKELQELLKFNPEYSDYESIKNAKRSYRSSNLVHFFDLTRYMEGVMDYRRDAESYSKPELGKDNYKPIQF